MLLLLGSRARNWIRRLCMGCCSLNPSTPVREVEELSRISPRKRVGDTFAAKLCSLLLHDGIFDRLNLYLARFRWRKSREIEEKNLKPLEENTVVAKWKHNERWRSPNKRPRNDTLTNKNDIKINHAKLVSMEWLWSHWDVFSHSWTPFCRRFSCDLTMSTKGCRIIYSLEIFLFWKSCVDELTIIQVDFDRSLPVFFLLDAHEHKDVHVPRAGAKDISLHTEDVSAKLRQMALRGQWLKTPKVSWHFRSFHLLQRSSKQILSRFPVVWMFKNVDLKLDFFFENSKIFSRKCTTSFVYGAGSGERSETVLIGHVREKTSEKVLCGAGTCWKPKFTSANQEINRRNALEVEGLDIRILQAP